MSFYIAGTGRCLPSTIVTNNDLAQIMETSDEWIFSRTGISSRRVCASETVRSLSSAAAKNAMLDANVAAEDIDMVICATMQGDTVTPSAACIICEELGISAPAFDVNAACSAMLYAFSIADGFFVSGKAKNILVVTVEVMSKFLDWTDRASCVLFGDGAGAVVLRAGAGLLSCHITCVPNSKMINLPTYGGDSPFCTKEKIAPILHMSGGEVYKFAVNTMMSEIEKALAEAGLEITDIDYVLPHQANLRIIEAAKKRFGLADDKVLMNISEYGNMSSTSIAVLLDDNARAGKFHKGDKLLMVAFGAGMTAAAAIIEWNK